MTTYNQNQQPQLEQQHPKTNDYLAADASGNRQHWVHNLELMTLAKSMLESAIGWTRINKHQPVNKTQRTTRACCSGHWLNQRMLHRV